MGQGADDRNLNFVSTVQILWNSLMDLETPATIRHWGWRQ